MITECRSFQSVAVLLDAFSSAMLVSCSSYRHPAHLWVNTLAGFCSCPHQQRRSSGFLYEITSGPVHVSSIGRPPEPSTGEKLTEFFVSTMLMRKGVIRQAPSCPPMASQNRRLTSPSWGPKPIGLKSVVTPTKHRVRLNILFREVSC